MKIYTRTGDKGTTGLLGGVRVPKDALRVCAYGDVDEANATIGAVAAHADATLARLVGRIQKDLFAIGAQLADPARVVATKRAKAAVTAVRVRRLEKAVVDGACTDVCAFLVLAMAHKQLGHAGEARRWLDDAVTWGEARSPTSGYWYQHVEFQILRREAEGLILGAATRSSGKITAESAENAEKNGEKK